MKNPVLPLRAAIRKFREHGIAVAASTYYPGSMVGEGLADEHGNYFELYFMVDGTAYSLRENGKFESTFGTSILI